MHFIPMGLLLKGDSQVLMVAGYTASDVATLNLQSFADNLIAVTTGNILGGDFLVALVYWFVYRRPRVQANEERERVADTAKA